MPDKNRYDSDSEKQVTSRRRFLHEGMKVGLKIAAGCFAFIPAANAFAKDVHSDRPNYIPCTTRVCYAYTCMTLVATVKVDVIAMMLAIGASIVDVALTLEDNVHKYNASSEMW